MRTAIVTLVAIVTGCGIAFSGMAHGQTMIPLMKAAGVFSGGVEHGAEKSSTTRSVNITMKFDDGWEGGGKSGGCAVDAVGGEDPLSVARVWGHGKGGLVSRDSASASTMTYQRATVKPGVDPASVPEWTPVTLKYDVTLNAQRSGSVRYELDGYVAAWGVEGYFEYSKEQRIAQIGEPPITSETFNGSPDFLAKNEYWLTIQTSVTCGIVAVSGTEQDYSYWVEAVADPHFEIDPAYPYASLLTIETISVPIPEPSTLVLLSTGVVVLLAYRLRRPGIPGGNSGNSCRKFS